MSKTDQERKEEAERWNSWQPGSGRKGWSPWGTGKPIPPVRDSATGHPIGTDGKVDWARVIREANERQD
jgi:hypothetical protein